MLIMIYVFHAILMNIIFLQKLKINLYFMALQNVLMKKRSQQIFILIQQLINIKYAMKHV